MNSKDRSKYRNNIGYMYIINIRVPEVIQTARLYQLLAVVLLVKVVS